MKIGFDLDGCVIQLMPTMLGILKKKYGLSYTEQDVTCWKLEDCLGITEQMTRSIVNESLGAWKSWKPYEGAIEFINEYHRRSGGIVTFITGRQPEFRIATYEWLDWWLPHIPYELILTGKANKGELARQLRIHMFIEDYFDGVLDLANNGIFVLMPARPWNRDVNLFNVITFNEWKDIMCVLDFYGGNNE